MCAGTVMKAAVLLGTSLVCASISASGFAILCLLLLTRSLAPPTAYFQKELFFDYTKPAAVASATFCQTPVPVKVRRTTWSSVHVHQELLHVGLRCASFVRSWCKNSFPDSAICGLSL